MGTLRLRHYEVEDASSGYAALVQRFQATRLLVASSTPHAIELLIQEGEAHRRLGNACRAFHLFKMALRSALQVDFASGVGWSLWGLGMLLRTRGLYAQSQRLFKRAYVSARRGADMRCMLWSRAESAETDRIVGNYRAAMDEHVDLRRDFRAVGDIRGVSWATSGIAQMLRISGAWSSARMEFLSALDIGQNLSDPLTVGWAMRGLAELAIEERNHQVALSLGEEARLHFCRAGYQQGVGYAEKTLADALLLAGRVHEAASMATTCRAAFREVGETRGLALSYFTLAKAAAAIGDPSGALLNASRAVSLMRKTVAPAPQGFDPERLLDHLQRLHPKLYRSYA